MSLQYTVVDAFTPKAFAGNPACVIVMPESVTLSTEQQLLIAREYNLSETAYLIAKESSEPGVARYGLRWFTPTVEVALCGHATLASAHALFSGVVPSQVTTLKFDTMSGELVAKRLEGGKIELEFPSGLLTRVDEEMEARAKKAFEAALGKELDVRFVGVGSGVSFQKYMLVEVGKEAGLEGLAINAGPLVDIPYSVIILTSEATTGCDFVSRVFAPAAGINEDPVTGSAHCLLGPYWEKKLAKAAGEAMLARQVSPRGGQMHVVWDEKAGKCRLQGEAVTVLKGELLYIP